MAGGAASLLAHSTLAPSDSEDLDTSTAPSRRPAAVSDLAVTWSDCRSSGLRDGSAGVLSTAAFLPRPAAATLLPPAAALLAETNHTHHSCRMVPVSDLV